MPRHRHSPATARGGRRFGLSAAHRSGAAPIGDPCRNLPGFASVRLHPRPEERSSCRSGASQPLLAALTTLSVCLGSALTNQAGTRQPIGAASLLASTAQASFLAGGGSRLAADNRRSRHEKSSSRFAAALYSRQLPAADHHRHHQRRPINDNISLCRSSPLRVYRSGKPCAPGGFT